MRRETLVQSRLAMGIILTLLCLGMSVVMVTAQTTPTSAPTRDPAVRRLVFVSAGFSESNRFWTIDRPAHLQFDPFLETLLDLDPKTGAFTPRLAEKWDSSPDLKEWTFFLRKGVSFGYPLKAGHLYTATVSCL